MIFFKKASVGAWNVLFLLLMGAWSIAGASLVATEVENGHSHTASTTSCSCSSSSSSSSDCSNCTYVCSQDTDQVLERFLHKFSCQHIIRARDVTPKGFVIDSPGQWCLSEDIVYSPSSTFAAITILSSNVTLDLNGKTLSLCSKEATGIKGIEVIAGLSNVTIANGTIRDFSQAGIYCDPPSWTEDSTSVCRILGVRALNNGTCTSELEYGTGGIVLFNTIDSYILDCQLIGNAGAGIQGFDLTKLTIDNCHCDDSSSALLYEIPFASGLALMAEADGNNNVLVKNSTFNRPTSSSFAIGIYVDPYEAFVQSEQIVIQGCEANDAFVNVEPSEFEVSIAAGAAFVECTNVVVENSHFLGSNVTCSETSTELLAAGIVYDKCTDVHIANCQFADSSIVNTEEAGEYAQSCGIDLEDVQNFTVTDCLFQGMSCQHRDSGSARETNVAGIQLYYCSQGVVKNCQMTSNSAYGPSHTKLITCGFFIEGACNTVLIEDCFAANNTQASTSLAEGYSIVAGFLAPWSNQIIFRRCLATNNQDASIGLAYGFSTRSPYSINRSDPTTYICDQYLFDSCQADGNLSNAGAAGFDIHDLIGSKVINCIAERNNVGIAVSEDVLGTSGNNIFQANLILANLLIGIEDLTTMQSNAYYSNRAESNGPCPSQDNYVGEIFPLATCEECCHSANKTPIRYWKLPYAPCKLNTNCLKSDVLDNLSIER